MSPDKWEDVKNQIKNNFEVEDEGTEDLLVETGDGPVKQGKIEFVEFTSPLGQTRLEFQTKPKLKEKKYHYSQRKGATADVEYEFSEDETVNTFKAFKWDDIEADWEEVDASSFENV